MAVLAETTGQQVINGVPFETGPPLELTADSVVEHQNMLVIVQPLDEAGEPLQVSANAYREVLPAKEDQAGWLTYLANLKASSGRVDAPFISGKLKPHVSGTHFSVAPEAKLGAKQNAPERLFQLGKALVRPLVQLSPGER